MWPPSRWADSKFSSALLFTLALALPNGHELRVALLFNVFEKRVARVKPRRANFAPQRRRGRLFPLPAVRNLKMRALNLICELPWTFLFWSCRLLPAAGLATGEEPPIRFASLRLAWVAWLEAATPRFASKTQPLPPHRAPLRFASLPYLFSSLCVQPQIPPPRAPARPLAPPPPQNRPLAA